MEKGKGIEAVDGETLLPEALIQHIQSFLSGKQAARTAILSKAWYSAWSTRPNLDFDQGDFFQNHHYLGRRSEIRARFLEFTKKTMQRYQELNLKIESLRLYMKGAQSDSSLANELIVKAMNMGATDLNFEVMLHNSGFVLPHEVFGAESLIKLSVCGCFIDLGVDVKVSCSRLKSLSLRGVFIQGDIVWDIISRCPLIEKLLLSYCTCLTTGLPSSPFIEFGKQNVGSVVDGPINLYEFHKLKCLLLEYVNIDTLFFHDFSSKFPCLKDLTVHYCAGYKRVQISSRILECISFAQERVLRAEFDVSSIRKFTYQGSCIPSVSFKKTSWKWEADISIKCSRYRTSRLNASWFRKLKKLLKKLSLSKLSLSLNIGIFFDKNFDCAGDVQGLHRPVVENLMLSMGEPSSVCSAILVGLFWSCRPKFITQLPKSCVGRKADNDFLELLCKTLIQEVSDNCCIPNRSMSGLHDLEDVNVEFFEESLGEWRPLPWKTLLDASESPENKRKVRFRLRWGLEPITIR